MINTLGYDGYDDRDFSPVEIHKLVVSSLLIALLMWNMVMKMICFGDATKKLN